VSSSIWTPAAVSSEACRFRAGLWRIVEAQHAASTMKLVDTAAEQDLLEILIDRAKPLLPAAALDLHYLLASPFRYPPYPGGSRFRAATDTGVFYGAEAVRTACAELGYWRWRFLTDAGLDHLEPVAHTAFRTRVETTAVDLRKPPFSRDAGLWMSPDSYTATQAFGRVAREADLGAIVYRSVRDPKPHWCAAVLTPAAFATRKPEAAKQSWWLAVTCSEAVWRREQESFTFPASLWATGTVLPERQDVRS